jgi:hypothetical protein
MFAGNAAISKSGKTSSMVMAMRGPTGLGGALM